MTAYRVARVTDREALRRFLDPHRYTYMHGDLYEPYWSNTEYWGAWSGERLVAVVLVYLPIEPHPVLSAGEAAAVSVIYEQSIVPRFPEIYYHLQPEHIDAVSPLYEFGEDHLPFWHMTVTPETFRAIAVTPARRLAFPDTAASGDLVYLPERDLMHIPAALIVTGTFFGIEADGRVVAAAGTHIVSTETGCGVVGWVFTEPDYRGRGYAAACTSAATAELFRRSLNVVGLNVLQSNAPALAVYEKLGYVITNPLVEGTGKRKESELR